MKILSLSKIQSDGAHNAFTGLAFFKNTYFVAFRHGETHNARGAHQILMTSPDGVAWKRQAETSFPTPSDLPQGTPMDLRDNYFLNLGSELRLYSFNVSPLVDDEYMRAPGTTVQVTKDGVEWTAPREIFSGAILWKPIFWNGSFWCAGYRRVPVEGYVVELYKSADGFVWERGSRIAVGNETFLSPQSGNVLRAYVRNQNAPRYLEIWEAASPFSSWSNVGHVPKIIEAPHIIEAAGRTFLFGREVPGLDPAGTAQKPFLSRSKVWEVDGCRVSEVLELPSLGDTSYFGTIVCPDGSILASYYSQHERETNAPLEMRGGNDKPADVFIARLEP